MNLQEIEALRKAQQEQLEAVGRHVLAALAVLLIIGFMLLPWYVSYWKRVLADADAYRVYTLQKATKEGCK